MCSARARVSAQVLDVAATAQRLDAADVAVAGCSGRARRRRRRRPTTRRMCCTAATWRAVSAQAQLLLGQHASLSDDPGVERRAMLGGALRYAVGADGDGDASPANGCAPLAQCARSRWTLDSAGCALAIGKAALRGFDLDGRAGRRLLVRGKAVAQKLGDAALLADVQRGARQVCETTPTTARLRRPTTRARRRAESSDWDAELESSSSEGNWDETLGVEQRAAPLRLAGVGGAPILSAAVASPSAAADADSPHDALADARILKADPSVDIVRLAKPPALLTMRTPQRLHVFHEAEFESWLSHIAELHRPDNSPMVASASVTPNEAAVQRLSPEFRAIYSDLTSLLEISRDEPQRVQLKWAIAATTRIAESPTALARLCLLRQLSFVMATQLQTRQAWNLIGQFFAVISASGGELVVNDLVRASCEDYCMDVLVLGAKLQRPSAPDSAAQFKLWCGELRRFAPWRANDLSLLQLEADVHHGAANYDGAMRRLMQLLRRVHESPDGARRGGSFGANSSTSSTASAAVHRRRSQMMRPPLAPVQSGAAAGASASSVPTLSLAGDAQQEEQRQKARACTFARILVLSYCLRTDLSPLSLERMRDVLHNSDGQSDDDDDDGDDGDNDEDNNANSKVAESNEVDADGSPPRRRHHRFEASDTSEDELMRDRSDPGMRGGASRPIARARIATTRRSRARSRGAPQAASCHRRLARRRRSTPTRSTSSQACDDSDEGALPTPPQSARSRSAARSPMIGRSGRAVAVDEQALLDDERRHDVLREFYVHAAGLLSEGGGGLRAGLVRVGARLAGDRALAAGRVRADARPDQRNGARRASAALESRRNCADEARRPAAADVDAAGERVPATATRVTTKASRACRAAGVRLDGRRGRGRGRQLAAASSAAGGDSADWFGPRRVGRRRRRRRRRQQARRRRVRRRCRARRSMCMRLWRSSRRWACTGRGSATRAPCRC
jgi:hypothetical protein